MQRHVTDGAGDTSDIGITELKLEKAVKKTIHDFETLVVLEFKSKTPEATVEWILKKLKSDKQHGGAQLLARTTLNEKHEETVLHISAKIEHLLVAAEIMELKKPYKDGTLREISMVDIDSFKNSGDRENFLSMAEKQRIILHEIESIRATDSDQHIAGLPERELYKGQTIVPECVSKGIIEKLFPLHDKEMLKRIGKEWFQEIRKPQPLDMIHYYFGETVAMYFAFLGYYTMCLIPPALISILSFFAPYNDVSMQIFFSIFNMVWVTIFLEAWKRNCSTLAYSWGTIAADKFEEARGSYHGKLSENKITGRLEPKYPKWKRMLKYYGVSFPIVLFCLFVAYVAMLWYFWMEDKALAYHKLHDSTLSGIILFLPTIIYAVLITVMNSVYRKFAKALNDWENHRLQSAYDNHLIVKLVLFDFANCFLSLFYVAFYLQDMALLRSCLSALLITQQVIGQIQEAVVPYIMYKRRKKMIKDKFQKSDSTEELLIDPLTVDDEYKLQAEIEGSKDEYDGTLEDYLEMFLQFGYVFLFSSVFPTAALWALLNNITEVKTDAFKMIRINQRPFSRPTSGIGAWQIAFEIMSVMAVLTNTALIALSPQVKEFEPDYGSVKVVLMFVLAEHLILFVKMCLSYLIPDYPEWVETALKRVEYQAKQAWIKERLQQAKRHLKERKAGAQGDMEIEKTAPEEIGVEEIKEDIKAEIKDETKEGLKDE